MIDGYLYISRNLQDNWLWTAEPFTKGQAWVDLIMMANYQSGHLLVRGVKVEVLRGQVGRSEDTLCKRWRWSKSKLRNYLKMLETDQQIKQQKSTVINIITIINYDIYQKPYNKTESKKKTEGKQKDTNNKEKEQIITNNEDIIPPKKYSDQFEEFWQAYPKNGASKADAYKSYNKAIKTGVSQNELINATRSYFNYCQATGAKVAYTAHATTWLNQERWTVDYNELCRTEKSQGSGNSNAGFIGQMERTAELARQRIADRG